MILITCTTIFVPDRYFNGRTDIKIFGGRHFHPGKGIMAGEEGHQYTGLYPEIPGGCYLEFKPHKSIEGWGVDIYPKKITSEHTGELKITYVNNSSDGSLFATEHDHFIGYLIPSPNARIVLKYV